MGIETERSGFIRRDRIKTNNQELLIRKQNESDATS